MLLSIVIVLTLSCPGILCMGPPFTPPGHLRGNNRGNQGHNRGNQGQNRGNQGHNRGNQGHNRGNQGHNRGNNRGHNKHDTNDYNNAGNEEPPFPEYLTTPKTMMTSISNPYITSTSKPYIKTTTPTTTTEEFFDIDVRFGGSDRRKRATNYFDASTEIARYLGYYSRWNRPNLYTKSDNIPDHLWTCVQNKFECVPQSECKTLTPKPIRRYCRWGVNEPYVCCEKLKNDKLKTFENKCRRTRQNEYSQAIVGGVSVKSGTRYPWMVAVGEMLPNDSVVWFCGGALIGERTVITAAHCISRRKADLVRLGETDLSQNQYESTNLQEIKIDETLPHPLYRPPTLYNDVALLRLNSPVQFNPFVRPICLPNKASLYQNPIALLTGWGQLNFASEQSSVLQVVTVRLFNNTYCNQQYSVTPASRRNFPNGILDTQLCAGDKEGGKDACQGDSGAPLVTEEDGTFVLTGIVSAGIGCGSKMFPGVYSKVASYAPWILENII